MKRWLLTLLATGAAVLTAAGFLTAAMFVAVLPAKAASLVQVTNFGSDPSNNLMYIYVPTDVRPDPPILMALHQCTGTGPGFYSSTAFASLANEYGFIVIYPDANRSGQCWDVSSSQALTRNGGSDPVGLMSMITYTEQHYGGNPNQVYITGASSGAMMTNVMLADYPDVFKAGVDLHGAHDWSGYLSRFLGHPDERYEQGDRAAAMETAWSSSPVAYISTWTSPVLLIQGDDDRNVAFHQTVDLARRLDDKGVRYEELVLPNEIHGFLRAASWRKADAATVEFLTRELGAKP